MVMCTSFEGTFEEVYWYKMSAFSSLPFLQYPFLFAKIACFFQVRTVVAFCM